MTVLEMHKNIINAGFFPLLFLVLFRKLYSRAFCKQLKERVKLGSAGPFVTLMQGRGPRLICKAFSGYSSRFQKSQTDFWKIWADSTTNRGSFLPIPVLRHPIRKPSVVFINLTRQILLCVSGKIFYSTGMWKMREIFFPSLTLSKYHLLPQGSEFS